MNDDQLHVYARECAQFPFLMDVDKKQLRFNDIVRVAKAFYYCDVSAGVKELVESCFRQRVLRGKVVENDLYVKGSPMWRQVEENSGWMMGA